MLLVVLLARSWRDRGGLPEVGGCRWVVWRRAGVNSGCEKGGGGIKTSGCGYSRFV